MTTPQPAALPELNPADIVVDVVCKAMGGFAPVNTSGVRVTHKPSGVSVTVDSERSQHKNKHLAWEKLRATLAALQSQPAAPQGVLMRLAAIAAECSDPDTTDALDALIASASEQPAAAGVSDAEIDRVLALAHAYADAKLMRYGQLGIKDLPDPQVAYEDLERAILALRPQAESEQEKELRRSLAEAQATISQRNAEIIELQKRIRRSPQAVRAIAGLGRVMLDDEVLTLQFDSEEAAESFASRISPSVDVDAMPELRMARPQAVPMTPAERERELDRSPVDVSWEAGDAFMEGIYAAEAHHGITAQGAQGGEG